MLTTLFRQNRELKKQLSTWTAFSKDYNHVDQLQCTVNQEKKKREEAEEKYKNLMTWMKNGVCSVVIEFIEHLKTVMEPDLDRELSETGCGQDQQKLEQLSKYVENKLGELTKDPPNDKTQLKSSDELVKSLYSLLKMNLKAPTAKSLTKSSSQRKSQKPSALATNQENSQEDPDEPEVQILFESPGVSTLMRPTTKKANLKQFARKSVSIVPLTPAKFLKMTTNPNRTIEEQADSISDHNNSQKLKHQVDSTRKDVCICGFKSRGKYSLTNHVKYFQTGKKFTCKICKKQFFNKSILGSHYSQKHKKSRMADKLKEKKGCRKCGGLFGNMLDLQIHRRIDHGVKMPLKIKKKTAIKATEKTAIKVAKKTAMDTAMNAAEETAMKASKKTALKAAEKNTKKAIKKTSMTISKKAVQKPSQISSRDRNVLKIDQVLI